MKTLSAPVYCLAGLLWLVAVSPLGAAEADYPVRDGLGVRFADDLSFEAAMRVHGDAVYFDEDVTPLDDEGDFRRARLGGTLNWSDWRLRADYDFGVSSGWKSAYLQYRGWRRQRVTLGNQVSPFSMEDLTSSNSLTLMERSVASALSPGMLFGLSYRTWGEHWSLHAGLFDDELSDQGRRTMPGQSGVARFAVYPVKRKHATLHLGVAGEYREIDDGEDVRLRARPGTRLTDTRLVDTQTFGPVSDVSTVGVELAAAWRWFRLQAEAVRSDVDRAAGDVSFDGHYVLASVLLNGSGYAHSSASGTFRAVKPRNRWGVVELAARVATVDLTDGGIAGGEQIETTFGLNWIFTRQLRLMLNYTDVDASPNRDGVDENPTLVSMRLQVAI
jgi:phosphate-selective porin OprO/OprP